MKPLYCYVGWRSNGKEDIKSIRYFQDKVLTKMRKTYPAYNFLLVDNIDVYFEKNHLLKSLGYSITQMDKADIVLVPHDYYRSRGCFIEFVTALKYNKSIYFYYNEGTCIYNIADVSKICRENNIIFTSPEINGDLEQIKMEELLPNDN